jgi:hypothetical protein
MTTYTEPHRPLEFLSWEAEHHLTREEGTLAANQGDLLAGTVLAKLTSGGQLVVYDNASATAGVAYGILAYPVANSSSTQKVTVIERMAVVKASLISWRTNDGTGIASGKTDLLGKNIRFIDPSGTGV